MRTENLPDITLEWLTCIECVKRTQVRYAEGWVPVERSVHEGDRSDDAVYKCPDCATASEEWEAHCSLPPLLRAVAEAEGIEPDREDDE